jgi:KDO2-lipid IV(A) lauroyltransferase
LPLRLLHAIAAIWGYLLSLIPGRTRNTTVKNLVACFPEKSTHEIKLLGRQSLQHTACTALEMGKSWLLPMDKAISMVTEVEGIELLQDTVNKDQGIVLLTPHLSNWEIFAYYVSQQIETTFMYQPPKIPALDRLLRKSRSRGGLKLAPTNSKGVAQLLTALKKGELVGILPDQVPPSKAGRYAPFFGEQALTMTLASKLVQRSGARVFCGFALRLPHAGGFRVIVKAADALIYDANLEQSVAGLNRSVEQCVELALAQYQWEYKRFRRRPDGKKFY